MLGVEREVHDACNLTKMLPDSFRSAGTVGYLTHVETYPAALAIENERAGIPGFTWASEKDPGRKAGVKASSCISHRGNPCLDLPGLRAIERDLVPWRNVY